jgi:anti-sigma regulatory factor (Ser/Thr protein kinase)
MVSLPPVSVIDRASVSVVRQRVRSAALDAGLPEVEVEELALAASELAQNQLDHARTGTFRVERIERDGVAGVSFTASDSGPGLASPAAAFAGHVVPNGLGAGLPTVRRLGRELDVDVRQGEGTSITMRRFAGRVRSGPELVVLGRGLEHPSGDHAWVHHDPRGLTLAVVDGVGHGVPARMAADAAVGAAAANPDASPGELLLRMDEACRNTRGVSVSVARWDLVAHTVAVAGVGNVSLRLFSGDGPARSLLPTPGIVGARSTRRVTERVFPLGSRPILLLHTDGLRATDGLAPQLLLLPPLLLAEHLLRHDARDHDDALVAVVR